MDKKILTIVVVAVVVIAAIAVAVVMMNSGNKNTDADGLSIVGRVNSEGSGIILAQGEDSTDYITVQEDMPGFGAVYIHNDVTGLYYVFNKENWGGKLFATPGAATIQHVQLMQLASMMGLKYVSYTDGTQMKSDTLYYIAGVPSFAEFVNKQSSAPLTGFIIWEAQVSVAMVEEYPILVLTNEIFEGHTCCIIGASNEYLEKEGNTLAVFFSVYKDAVDKINNADRFSDDYAKLVEIATKRVSMPDGMTDEEKIEAIKSALNNVTYVYADDNKGSLNLLKKDIAKLAEDLYNSKQISMSAKDLGFNSYDELAQKFVDDSYMKKAIAGTFTPLSEKKTINIAAISGDIHQIALWFAMDTGMFEDAKLDVKVYPQSNGPAVYGLLSNGEADLGFLGAPPMTIRSMNGEDIHA